MVKKIIFLMLMFLSGIACSDQKLSDADIWLSKTSGIWELNDKYGYYQVSVYRQGVEHASDVVVVRELTVENNKKHMSKQYQINTPGIKGYVAGIEFKMIDSTHMALLLDIEMKGMNGIVLREVYILSPNGKVRKIQDAQYKDIYEK